MTPTSHPASKFESQQAPPESRDEHAHPNVIVLGLDAADWDVLNPLLESGTLPNLAGMLKDGVGARLSSTIPDMTPPSWTSITTGVNPGKHGVFGFSQPSGGLMKLTDSSTCQAPAVWDVLDAGCRKLVVNVPLTYPVRPLNGCMISDSLTSVRRGDWVWPREEKAFLDQWGYEKACIIPHISKVQGVAQLGRSVRTRGRVFLDLMKKYHPCFSMIVFSETDWVQHIFPEEAAKIGEIYAEVDALVGEIISRIRQETLVTVVSDHGFRFASRKFFVNNWLVEKGLLRVHQDRPGVRKSVVRRVAVNVERSIPSFVRLLPRRVRENAAGSLFSPADDLKLLSGVYHSGWDLGQYLRLYLTDDVRDRYEEFHKRLQDESASLEDKGNRQKPVRRVLTKGQVYSGRFIVTAPDFILDLAPGYSGNERILTSGGSFLDLPVGIHRDAGVFMAKWFLSKRKIGTEVGKLSVYDLASTIAVLFDKAVRTDGEIIEPVVGRVHS